MRKTYLIPKTECMPIGMVSTLCASGATRTINVYTGTFNNEGNVH